MLQTVSGLPCEWHLESSQTTVPTDKELRAYIAQARRTCPEGSRLDSIVVRLWEGTAQVAARYSGLSRFESERKTSSPAKPLNYTLYDAVELAEARIRRSFHNTWHSCSACKRSQYTNPTKKIGDEWICYRCWKERQRAQSDPK